MSEIKTELKREREKEFSPLPPAIGITLRLIAEPNTCGRVFFLEGQNNG